MPLSPFALALARITHEAGHIVLKHYGSAAVRFKSDASPVTDADEEAEAYIVERLKSLAPAVPVIAEESSQGRGTPEAAPQRFFLVDPLDGTKEFLKKNGEFTVNIALIENGRAVCGIVGAPALQRIFAGEAGNGAYLFEGDAIPSLTAAKAIKARTAPAHGLSALVSRSHETPETDDYLARHVIAERLSAGSSLKFCFVAEGRADLYPRLGPTMEWDTAAGQAVLEAAGGSVITVSGKPLGYGKADMQFRNPNFVARGLL